MKFNTSRIIHSNGEKYRAGWDEYGWFTIQEIVPHPGRDEWVPNPDGELRSFNLNGAKELVAAIEEGL